LYLRLVTFGVHLGDFGVKNRRHADRFRHLTVALEVARVSLKVFTGTEL
jgi:hypothetical protein